MSRHLYSFALSASLPLVWLWAALRRRDFLRGFVRRLGVFLPDASPCVWVHAASVGEVQGISPLVTSVHDRVHCPILFTTFTPTGAEQVKKKFGETLVHTFIPWDTPGSVRRFLRHFRPTVLIVMETEIWPNVFYSCQQQGIPIVLVNARLGDKAFRRYQKSPRLFRALFERIDYVGARSRLDAERFQALGIKPERIEVTGNIKFTIAIESQHIAAARQFKAQRNQKIWLAASTHPGEDDIVLKAHRQLKEKFPDLLLVLVPRHPKRANDVGQLIQRSGFSFVRRTQQAEANPEFDVLLVDTLGELMTFYLCADVAFIGGSLVSVGGHNPLEAAVAGCPVISGRQVHNFRDEYALFADQNAVVYVDTENELADAVAKRWLDDVRYAAMANSARQILEDNQGALAKTQRLLERFLPN